MTDIDPDDLGRAFHALAQHGGPLTPCGYVAHPGGEYVRVDYDAKPPEDPFACMCAAIARGILREMER